MKAINVYFEDKEWERLNKAKGNNSWRKYIYGLYEFWFESVKKKRLKEMKS